MDGSRSFGEGREQGRKEGEYSKEMALSHAQDLAASAKESLEAGDTEAAKTTIDRLIAMLDKNVGTAQRMQGKAAGAGEKVGAEEVNEIKDVEEEV